ncbi:MAG: outer membrane lipoprotein carrier protein LolA [Polyangiales bacterium]
MSRYALRAVFFATALTLAAPRVHAEPPAAAAPSAAPTLDAVLGKLAAIAALSARFREEKRMSLLAAPLVSEGRLLYQKPRLLARHTDKPRKASLLLKGDTLSFGGDKEEQSISLSSQPSLRVLVDTFVSVLAGDRAALERVATVTVEARDDGGYRIHLTPKDDKVKRLVKAMTFDGKGAALARMELIDASGDTTVTTFSDVAPRKVFSDAERARLFRIGK